MTQTSSAQHGQPIDRASVGLFCAGLGIGFVGSLCGIGGGLFAVPLLHLARRFDLKEAVATALGLVLATTAASTLTELAQPDSRLDAGLLAMAVSGVLVGSQLGFRLAERIPVGHLKRVFVLVLSIAGARMVLAPGVEVGAQAEFVFSLAQAPLAFLIGVAGGFVAPLLGVGGGLIMVPAFYLSLAGCGFATARAVSLATGSVGALRSLWLHARAGRVRWASAASLGLGALFGAVVGTLATRLAGFAEAGRLLLGLVLWLVALRFVVELWRRPRSA